MTCQNCDRLGRESLKEKNRMFALEREFDEAIKLLELMKPHDAVWNEGDEANLVRFREVLKG